MAKLDNLAAVKKCLNRVEKDLDRLASLKASYMSDCKEIRDEIRQTYEDGRQSGVNVIALKTLVATRILKAGIDKAIDNLDVDDRDSYISYAEAWDTTPLGMSVEEGK
jgi:uncharacterized protein (UPF0335 family)